MPPMPLIKPLPLFQLPLLGLPLLKVPLLKVPLLGLPLLKVPLFKVRVQLPPPAVDDDVNEPLIVAGARVALKLDGTATADVGVVTTLSRLLSESELPVGWSV